jgi:hypothetical protein
MRITFCLCSRSPLANHISIPTDMMLTSLRYTGLKFALSSSSRCGISKYKVLVEAVSKRRVATSSFLSPSINHSRENTYQDNDARASKTIFGTQKLHIHTTERLSTHSKTIMAPKQKIIIDTDPVCHLYTAPTIKITANINYRVSMIFWPCF